MHAALRAGADGFLLKNSHPDDLARTLHAAVGKEPVLAPSVTRRLIDTLTALPPAFLADTPDAPPAPGEPALTELLTRSGRASPEPREQVLRTGDTAAVTLPRSGPAVLASDTCEYWSPAEPGSSGPMSSRH